MLELAAKIQPLSDYAQISLLLKQSAEARHLLSVEPDFSVGDVLDIRRAVAMAARGKILEPRNLLEIQQTLSAIRELRGKLSTLSQEAPLLWNIAEGIVELYHLEQDITDHIAPNTGHHLPMRLFPHDRSACGNL